MHLRRGLVQIALLSCTLPLHSQTAPAKGEAAGDPLSPLMRSGMAATTQVQYEVRVQPVTPQPAADAARVGGNAKVAGPVTRYRADFVIHRESAPSPDSTRKDRLQVEVIAFDRSGKALNWQAGVVEPEACGRCDSVEERQCGLNGDRCTEGRGLAHHRRLRLAHWQGRHAGESQ